MRSAGLLLFRHTGAGLEVLLVHPGGPFWAKKDEGAWSIPKGEIAGGEDPFDAAKREFAEEIGCEPSGEFLPLRPVRQAGGKLVHAWALRSELNVSTIRSNLFSMEWPPRSGRQQQFPEIDRAAWFTLDIARLKILKSQLPLLDDLLQRVGRVEEAP
ncbi:MAG TPA: NUDIX domain-containing protein [Verrucomicrobiae bacterium]|nr:NUDIX domain-containing protein [Verrucomicrobiae bacterium]